MTPISRLPQTSNQSSNLVHFYRYIDKSLIFHLSDCCSCSGPPSFKELSQITSQFNSTRIEDRNWSVLLAIASYLSSPCPALGWHSGNVCWMNERLPTAYRILQSGVLSPHRVSPHSPPPEDHSSTCSLCSSMWFLTDMFCLSLQANRHPLPPPPLLAPAPNYFLLAN